MRRFAVLASGRGSNLEALLATVSSEDFPGRICVVASNKPKARALDVATEHGIPTAVLSHKGYARRRDYDADLVRLLQAYRPDWILLAGFMRVLTPTFLDAFGGRVLNIHPSLLPAFPGLNAQQQALDAGASESGCTVHLVDAGTDTGPILAQAVVPVRPDDTEETLSTRILAAEHQLYPQVLRWVAENRVHVGEGWVTVDLPPGQARILRF
ncbi:MAG: phosphoribosylglycinamide formyltransferase [Deltaproteobacteria bacterium]|nr:MAG: phosphoribosylglycinamide formyltransferase [Deltaproteobacteria bacterium]